VLTDKLDPEDKALPFFSEMLVIITGHAVTI